MKADWSADPGKRNRQLEAKAHIAVQRWIDEGGVRGRAVAAETICELHRRFSELLPDELMVVADPKIGRTMQVAPGEWRRDDVRVGRHLAISAGAVPRFVKRFRDVYGTLGRSDTIVAAAAAHHRLVWIHPFIDGNGRVARLMSHALLLEALDTGGIWSVARGLARSVNACTGHLMNCDSPRRNDLDGRGTLSEEALVEFTRFFLETCIDQVRFMEELVQPDRLRDRILLWTEEEVRAGELDACTSTEVLQEILYRCAALKRLDLARQVYELFAMLCPVVYPVTLADTDRAKQLVCDGCGIGVRDAIHAAVMLNNDIDQVATFDAGFDLIHEVRRLPFG
jgi:Fic family protein